MNTEKLHKITLEIKGEYDRINLVNKLTELRNYLQNAVNQPQQPAHQQNLAKVQKEVLDYLDTAPSNTFSPLWKQIVEEIGGDDLLGKKLKGRIEEVFNRNQITPSNALGEINNILKESQEFYNSINQVVTGFKGLHIGKEDLKPGECEVSYMIPRPYTKENLTLLKKEITELNFILNNISEVATGEKDAFTVNSISSSDYSFFINVPLLVGYILIKATEKILDNYKKILEIKNLRNQLIEQGIPDKKTQEIENYANETMEKEIIDLAKDIVKEHYRGRDTGRKNELISGLKISFNKIANRIDNGFNLDIRVEVLSNSKNEEEKNEEHEQKEALISTIKESSKSLEFINTTGKTILSLNESNDSKSVDSN